MRVVSDNGYESTLQAVRAVGVRCYCVPPVCSPMRCEDVEGWGSEASRTWKEEVVGPAEL